MTNAERLCANKAELAQACGMLCQRIESCWACPLIYFCKGTMRGVEETEWRQWMEAEADEKRR